jgi:hypothetical protein
MEQPFDPLIEGVDRVGHDRPFVAGNYDFFLGAGRDRLHPTGLWDCIVETALTAGMRPGLNY